MITLWTLLLASGIIALFWMSRIVADAAKRHAEHQAKQLNVQLLSVACKKWRPGIVRGGKPGIKSEFMFEFCSDGNTVYQGSLQLENERLVKIDVPPYRMG
ncbi:DUF3301 domain-containing protein [Pseudoalteromonas fenneropenaei]|uniref:DUF3301 domain-containing protein n=1 Tax=Pseudoalteromonas fenneropenaei TaxID=1737459 RepID=A0ABV7CGF4_9GAMM